MLCNYCGKEFINKKALNAHKGISHKDELLKEKYKVRSRTGIAILDISVEDLENKRLKHSNVCDVCGKIETANTCPDKKDIPNNLCVDHEHTSNRFR